MNLPGIVTEKGCLSDFLADIKGQKDLILNTDDAIRSTRETLQIQDVADKSE